MLYETAARAAEIPALDGEDLDLEHRRARARSKGGAIMGKTRHKNPCTAMRYVNPGAETLAAVTAHLAPPRRTC
ncbi:MAG TPA: hypothetical protein VM347_09955 [Nonomuraea sp.]|nr:hypothetical protein [Nonomuraea sp.]